MSLDPHVVADRRQLKRTVNVWRFLAFIFIGVGLFLILHSLNSAGGGFVITNDHIAEVRIDGEIRARPKLIKQLDKLSQNTNVKGVIVSINSHGGTSVGGESIYAALRILSKQKPTVAQMWEIATSAGYMVALGAEHIVAYNTTITGSIGAIIAWADFSELLSRTGVKYNEIKSSAMKAEPSPFKPISPEGREMNELVLKNTYDWFVRLVAERRNLEIEKVRELADGRLVNGRMARELKLIDGVGGRKTVKKWLESKGVNRNLNVIRVYPVQKSRLKRVIEMSIDGFMKTIESKVVDFLEIFDGGAKARALLSMSIARPDR